MAEHSISRFPVSDVHCPTPGCPRFRETDHRLVCITTLKGETGVRCEECETLWETAAAYFSLLSPWPQVWSGTLFSGLAAIAVWFLPWALWLKLLTAALTFFTMLQAIQRTLFRLGRKRAYTLLSELTLPANLTPDERLEKRLKQLTQLSRMDALRAQKGSVTSWLRGFETHLLPQIVETQHRVRLCRPSFIEALPQRLKQANFTEEEHRFLQEQLIALQQVAERKDRLKSAWEEDITRLESIVFVLQDLVLTESGLEQPLRRELAQLMNEGYTLLAVLAGEEPEISDDERSELSEEEELASLFAEENNEEFVEEEDDEEAAEIALLKSELTAMSEE
jgi:hypothetical protein